MPWPCVIASIVADESGHSTAARMLVHPPAHSWAALVLPLKISSCMMCFQSSIVKIEPILHAFLTQIAATQGANHLGARGPLPPVTGASCHWRPLFRHKQ